MKNILESLAVFLVMALSLLIVFLIVQYNMIEEDAVEEVVFTAPVKKAMEVVKPEIVEVKDPEDLEKLPEEEIEDEVEKAIDAALEKL